MDTQTQVQKKETSEASTQTEPRHDEKYKPTLKSLAVEGMIWDKELYKKTEVIVGNPLTTGDNTTKVVLVEPNDPEMSSSIQRLYREKFSELVSVQGDFEILEQITKIRSKETTELSIRKIIKVTHDGTA